MVRAASIVFDLVGQLGYVHRLGARVGLCVINNLKINIKSSIINNMRYGFPYERLPNAMKAPVAWAIAGAVIGVITGFLAGASSPFLVGVGLLAAGATIGALVRDDDSLKAGGFPPRPQDAEAIEAGGLGIEQEPGGKYFQNMIERGITRAGRTGGRYPG